jgi:alanine racemase
LPELLNRIESRDSLKIVGLCSHLASAASPSDPYMLDQLRRFQTATAFDSAWRNKITRHIASSGAIFSSSASHLDMVRPGIALFGIDPALHPSMNRPLKPAMKWTAPLLNIRDIPAGTGIGYDHSFIAPRPMRIGLVPVGYADGYLRAFSNQAVMMFDGIACPVVGQVSMDSTTIDLSRVIDAAPGDEITVLDNDPLSPCSVYELARHGQTVPYEIFTRIGPRIRRVAVEPANDAPETPIEDESALFE